MNWSAAFLAYEKYQINYFLNISHYFGKKSRIPSSIKELLQQKFTEIFCIIIIFFTILLVRNWKKSYMLRQQ